MEGDLVRGVASIMLKCEITNTNRNKKKTYLAISAEKQLQFLTGDDTRSDAESDDANRNAKVGC